MALATVNIDKIIKVTSASYVYHQPRPYARDIRRCLAADIHKLNVSVINRRNSAEASLSAVAEDVELTT